MQAASTLSPIDAAPVFIGGPHRSGTGMIRAVLGSNSQLAIPPKEYQFFEHLPPQSLPPQVWLEQILQWPKVQEWALSGSDPHAMLDGTDLSDRAVYAAPLLLYAHQRGKARFGEKTPYLEAHFETLLAWFGPRTRFVQMIRDPLPTLASLNRQDGVRRFNNPVRFARRWLASALRGLDFSRRYPDNFMLMRYEDFTEQPLLWTQRLCTFCDLPPETETMLSMRDFTRKSNSSFSSPMPAEPGHYEVSAAPARRVPNLSRLDTALVAGVLGPLIHGIGSMLDQTEELPVHRIAEETRRDVPLLSHVSVAAARAAAIVQW